MLRSSLPSFVPPFVRPSLRSSLRSFVPSFVRPFVRSFVCSSGLNLQYTPLSSWADPELPNCHRHRILHRRSRRIHLPESQQRPFRWIESASPLSWSWTAELSPPLYSSPEVTTALSPWHHKAKASRVAASCGWSARAVRHSPSSISASSKVCSKSTRTRFSAVISLRCFFPKARWAFVLTSWTVEEGGSGSRSSACPFGKATFIWILLDFLKILTTFQNISNVTCTWSPSQARIDDWGMMQSSERESPFKLSPKKEPCSNFMCSLNLRVHSNPSIKYGLAD